MPASNLLQRLLREDLHDPRTTIKRRRERAPRIESLEQRTLLAADLRAITGVDNNLANPEWGSTDEQLLRFAPAAYSDGMAAPAGDDRPGAREVSNLLSAQIVDQIFNDRNLSAMSYAWGQFVDHDIDLTNAADPAEPLPIPVPTGDIYFDPQATGTQTIGFSRSAYDSTTGTSPDNPRQQINRITAFLDGSQIYGSDEVRAQALRTGQGGRLKTSAGDLLPFNTAGLPNDNPMGHASETLFLAGDVRANENVELTALQTLFVREHNRLADGLAARHRFWSDEQIYQEARRLVIGELQAITYNEFLPALLGDGALAPYTGYDSAVNPGIANEFSTAGYRLGHSMLGNSVRFMDNTGNAMHDDVALRGTFFNPELLEETGIDSILKFLASDHAQEIDNQVVDEVRNFLFGPPGAGGFDLAALNLQRGRDHGLADYNSARLAYGLVPVTSFAEITSDELLQQALADAYGDVNNIDLWAGGLAEDHLNGASVGPLFGAILVDQFERLRDGDRFWYERDLSGQALRQVRSTTLADVISRNTSTTNLQDNVFFFFNSIEGQVFLDANGDGRFEAGEVGMNGMTVELHDADGNLVASALTASDGSYAFEDLGMGVYQVHMSVPDGMRETTRRSDDVDLTRGEEHSDVDIGLSFKPARNPWHGHFDQILDNLRDLFGWSFWTHWSQNGGIDANGGGNAQPHGWWHA
jgi:peroxidase